MHANWPLQRAGHRVSSRGRLPVLGLGMLKIACIAYNVFLSYITKENTEEFVACVAGNLERLNFKT